MKNAIFVEGRVTKEPLLKKTEGGKHFVEFTIADSVYYKGGGQNGEGDTKVSFWLCRKYVNTEVSAQGFLKMLQKGDLVNLRGSITKTDYKDGEIWKSWVMITVDEVDNKTNYARNYAKKLGHEPENQEQPGSASYASPVEDDLPF